MMSVAAQQASHAAAAAAAMDAPNSTKYETECQRIQLKRQNAGQCPLCGIQTHRLVQKLVTSSARSKAAANSAAAETGEKEVGAFAAVGSSIKSPPPQPRGEEPKGGPKTLPLGATGETQKDSAVGAEKAAAAVTSTMTPPPKDSSSGDVTKGSSSMSGVAAATTSPMDVEPQKPETAATTATSPMDIEQPNHSASSSASPAAAAVANEPAKKDTAKGTADGAPKSDNASPPAAKGESEPKDDSMEDGDDSSTTTETIRSSAGEEEEQEKQPPKEEPKNKQATKITTATSPGVEQKSKSDEKQEATSGTSDPATLVREPLTNDHVLQGRCLLCHPLPKSSEKEQQQHQISGKQQPSTKVVTSPTQTKNQDSSSNIQTVMDMEFTIPAFDKVVGKYSGPVDAEKRPHGSGGTFVLAGDGEQQQPHRTYTGDFEHGHIQGRGILKFGGSGKDEITVYDGEWAGSQANGTGVSYTPEGDVYQGQFANNERCGNGVLQKANGDRFVGQFQHDRRNGMGYFVWSGGDKYVGEWANNARHGRGVFTWADGENYMGSFLDSHKHGAGIYTWKNGDRYDGQFWHGRMHGYGNFTKVNGQKYSGSWINDKREGHGLATWASGQYDGEWVANKFHGRGTFCWSDKDRYSGEWKQSLRHGKGSFTDAAGNTFEGLWKDDHLVSSSTFIRGFNGNVGKMNLIRNADRSLSIEDDAVVGANSSSAAAAAGNDTASNQQQQRSGDYAKKAVEGVGHEKTDRNKPMAASSRVPNLAEEKSIPNSNAAAQVKNDSNKVSGQQESGVGQGTTGSEKLSKRDVTEERKNDNVKPHSGNNMIVSTETGGGKPSTVESGGKQSQTKKDTAGGNKRSIEEAGITSTNSQDDRKKSRDANEAQQTEEKEDEDASGVDDFGFGDDLMGPTVMFNVEE